MARNYRKLALHKRVIVNLTTGQAIAGVLWDEKGPLLVLRDAQLHEPGASGSVPMDGEQIIDRSRISFTQVVT